VLLVRRILLQRKIFKVLLYLENSKLVSCPKLIRTLQQILDDARSNELITFKKMAKINDMNEYERSTIDLK
jgi:hypothetical protein